MSAKVAYEDLAQFWGQKLPRCGPISNRARGFGRPLSYGILLSIASQSLLNRDNPTLAYPTDPQLAVDAYHLAMQ